MVASVKDYPPDTVLFCAFYDDEGVTEAKAFIEMHKLTFEDVKLLKVYADENNPLDFDKVVVIRK